jgi:hypothetical protein
MNMRDIRFDRIQWFGNSFTRGLAASVQIVRHLSHILDKPQYPAYPTYHTYHRYEGLSSPPTGGRYREDIPDTKHSIYKHYIGYMRDIGI